MRPELRILWSDSAAGTAVGLVTLTFSAWLTEFYRLPREVIRWIGCANLVYGVFAAVVATSVGRALRAGSGAQVSAGRRLVMTLLTANAAWAGVCWWLLVNYAAGASLFGRGHLALEGLFVLGLAGLEYQRVLPLLTAHVQVRRDAR